MIYCELCGNPTEWLTVGRVAQLFQVQPKTVRKWIKAGRFPGTEQVPGYTGGMMYRIPITAVIPPTEEASN